MYHDEFEPFDYEREPYENDLEELMDREAFEDLIAERDEHRWDERDEEDPELDGDFEPEEDQYLDSLYEDRYYEAETFFDY